MNHSSGANTNPAKAQKSATAPIPLAQAPFAYGRGVGYDSSKREITAFPALAKFAFASRPSFGNPQVQPPGTSEHQ